MAYFLNLHHFKESVKEIVGIFWTAAGFRVELHAEGWFVHVVDAFTGAVVGVDKTDIGNRFVDAVAIYGVAVVLAGDKDAVSDGDRI